MLTAALNRTARERDGARQQLDTFVKEFEPLAAFISQGSVGHPGECVFEVAIERIKLAETKVKNLSASLTEVVDSHNAKVREIERLQGRLADERNRTDAGSTGPGRCLFLENELALVREQRDNARKILAKYEKTATQIVQEQNREASQRNELNLLRMERDGARKELARLGAMLKGMSDSITTR